MSGALPDQFPADRANWEEILRRENIITTLPKTPQDGLTEGREVRYRFVPATTPADPTPVIWNLYYDKAFGAWLPIGDAKAVTAVVQTFNTGAFGGGAWGSIATEPAITGLPPGFYEIDISVGQLFLTALGNWYAGLIINGSFPSASGVQPTGGETASIPASNSYGSGRSKFKKALPLASNTMSMIYYFTTGGSLNINNRSLSARPLWLTA